MNELLEDDPSVLTHKGDFRHIIFYCDHDDQSSREYLSWSIAAGEMIDSKKHIFKIYCYNKFQAIKLNKRYTVLTGGVIMPTRSSSAKKTANNRSSSRKSSRSSTSAKKSTASSARKKNASAKKGSSAKKSSGAKKAVMAKKRTAAKKTGAAKRTAAKKGSAASKKRATARKTNAGSKKKVAAKRTAAKRSSAKKAGARSKYSAGAQNAVKKEVHAFKRGQAHSGVAKRPVKSRKQAIAIGLSKARKQGARVPKKAAA